LFSKSIVRPKVAFDQQRLKDSASTLAGIRDFEEGIRGSEVDIRHCMVGMLGFEVDIQDYEQAEEQLQ